MTQTHHQPSLPGIDVDGIKADARRNRNEELLRNNPRPESLEHAILFLRKRCAVQIELKADHDVLRVTNKTTDDREDKFKWQSSAELPMEGEDDEFRSELIIEHAQMVYDHWIKLELKKQ